MKSKETGTYMKRNRTIAMLLALALCAALLCAGCAGKKVLAATVGDREITVYQLQTAYQNQAYYYSLYGMPIETKEDAEMMQDYILESYIQELVKAYEAEQAGIELTQDEKAEAKKTAAETYESYYQSFVTAAENSGAAEPDVYANTILTDELLAEGSSVAEKKKLFLQDAEDSLRVAKHKEQLLADVTYSEDELKAKFDEELAAQKTAIDADKFAYENYLSSTPYGALYAPEGIVRVRQILVADEATANEVLDKLNAGADFEALLTEYNTDSGMSSYPSGYYVYDGAAFVEPFLNAALALASDGDVSEAVQSEYGYHIIKRVGSVTPGELTYENVKDTFDEYWNTKLQDETYQSIVDGWLAEAPITRYPENYRTVGGADALPTATPAAEPTAAPETAAETEGDAE